MRRQVVFVEGGRVESVLSRFLVRVGLDSFVFMSTAGEWTPESFTLPKPVEGSVLQADFNKVLEWCFAQLRFDDVECRVIEKVVGSSQEGSRSLAEEVKAALCSRLASRMWTVAYAEHFLGNYGGT